LQFTNTPVSNDPLDGLTFSAAVQPPPEDPYDSFWLGDYESEEELTSDDNGDNSGAPEEAHATKVGIGSLLRNARLLGRSA